MDQICRTLGRVCLAAAAIVLASSAAASETWNTYGNARFGYVLAYPASLLPQPEADNGDGRHFLSADGQVDLAVWAGYNVLEETPAALAADAEKRCGDAAAYKVVKAALVTVSCIVGQNVYYHKTVIRGDTLTTFELTYPVTKKSLWDRVVQTLSKSLQPAK